MSAKPKPQFTTEIVTPAIAESYLALNTKNRPLSASTVKRYAAAMKRGEWELNGEAIKFDAAGKLIDGQHRLKAVVVSGVAVELGVFRSLASSAFATLDTGRTRTGGDVLAIADFSYANELAAAARLLWWYGNADRWSEVRSSRLSHVQLVELVDAHPDLVKCTSAAMAKPLYNYPLVPHSVTVFTYYAASRVDADKALQFFTELATGKFSPTSDAVHALRERLIQISLEAVKPPPVVKLGWIISAWNAALARRPLERLSRTAPVPRFIPEPVFRKSSKRRVSRETD